MGPDLKGVLIKNVVEQHQAQYGLSDYVAYWTTTDGKTWSMDTKGNYYEYLGC